MKNKKKKLDNQSKVVKVSFTGSNITKYSGLNTVAKYMNRQNIVKSISTLFPTQSLNARHISFVTAFAVGSSDHNQVIVSVYLNDCRTHIPYMAQGSCFPPYTMN